MKNQNLTGAAYIAYWANKVNEFREAVDLCKRDGLKEQEKIWQRLLDEAIDVVEIRCLLVEARCLEIETEE